MCVELVARCKKDGALCVVFGPVGNWIREGCIGPGVSQYTHMLTSSLLCAASCCV